MENLFKIKERGSSVSKEIIGGITTFLAMSYILAVNPGILCDGTGMEWGAVFTATAVSAAIATLVMAFLANMPVALAASLGLNTFFTYSVVLGMGCSWQLALTAVLIEGIVFILLSMFGVREAIIDAVPTCMKKAVSVGIGLFVAIIGLVNAGICVHGPTIISFANLNMENVTALVAVIGLIITIFLYVRKVPGAILIGIVLTTIIGIPFGVTTVPKDFKPFSAPSTPYFLAFDFKGIAFDSNGVFQAALLGKFFVIFFTFLFSDMFDTLGTLMGVADQAKLVDKNGKIQNVKMALFADSIGTVAGACLGTSTVTSFVESSSGVAAGARTGLASLVTGILFLLALFLSPLFFLIPACATAPALIFVGFMMMRAVMDINFADPTDGIPASLAIMTMPFAYSIAKGISWGIIAYVLAKFAGKKAKDIPAVTWILAIIFIADIIFEAVK